MKLMILVSLFSSLALAQTLEPHKDKYFSNKDRKVIEAKYNGMYTRYKFDEMKDVNGRDTKAKPGLEARPERIEQIPIDHQADLTITYPGGEVNATEVGARKDAKFAVIYIHGAGQGADKSQGQNDLSFGGNFNRLKNLADKNGGVYYTPTVTGDWDGKRTAVLIDHIKKNSPNAKIVMACASAGASTCWQMGEKKETATKLSGLIFLGGADINSKFENSQAFINNVPIIISHGSKDPLVPIKSVQENFEAMRKSKPNYPVKMEVFEGGKHGTPMRLFDWKENLNWLFSRDTNASDSGASSDKATPAASSGSN